MGLIFGDSFDASDLQSCARRDYRRPRLPPGGGEGKEKEAAAASARLGQKGRTANASSGALRWDTLPSLAPTPRPKNIVDPTLRGAYAETRQAALRGTMRGAAGGAGHGARASQVDCGIIGARFDATTEYQAQCAALRQQQQQQQQQHSNTTVGLSGGHGSSRSSGGGGLVRSSFAAPCNPITGLPTLLRPAPFEHVAGGGPHCSLDSRARAEQNHHYQHHQQQLQQGRQQRPTL